MTISFQEKITFIGTVQICQKLAGGPYDDFTISEYLSQTL